MKDLQHRIERLEAQLGEALGELTATRALVRDLRRESESLEKRLDVAQEKAAWYRSKLLGFVSREWIKQEKAKDGK
jgi:peptidoglycan hydrolase CwlO-like protein